MFNIKNDKGEEGGGGGLKERGAYYLSFPENGRLIREGCAGSIEDLWYLILLSVQNVFRDIF